MYLLHGDYQSGVVFLSFIMAMLASYSALNLVHKISYTAGRKRLGWLLAGSFVMGSGIWTMHFVGMLAFHLGVPVTYHIPTTILSIFAAIAASFAAFYVTMDNPSNRRTILLGAVLMGAGIVTMHYTGMAAMRSALISLSYDPFIWALSAVIGIVVSYAALTLFVRFRSGKRNVWSKWGAALLMGLAVCSMHYTGMESAQFWCTVSPGQLSDTPLGYNLPLLIGVTLTCCLIMLVVWGAIYFDRNVLEKMAFTDALTGLPNRHAMNQWFEEELLEPAESSTGVAVFFIDLDQFKTINDTLGHDIGDLLVQQTASRLKSYLNEGSQAFRLGGDEFLLVAKGINEEQAERTAALILDELRKPYLLEDHELYVTGSVGISLAPKHGKDRQSLLKTADTAMYQAKRNGKNQYCLFNDELDQKLMRRMLLEKDMRQALVKEQFLLHYQPKFNASLHTPIGFEALMRWQHPVLGLIGPDEFIPIAEDTRLIVPMTRWALEKACMDCQAWNHRNNTELGVSVNLSVNVFASKNLQDMVVAALLSSNLDPALLELEITESIVMNDIEDVISQLRPLREMGISVSMDDFGAGYSSLGTIDRIPFKTIKIDKLYMLENASPAKRTIVQTIIAMANSLELDVLAEGVENEQQIAFLMEAGCTNMQGYYFSRPIPREQLDEWLHQWKRQQAELAETLA